MLEQEPEEELDFIPDPRAAAKVTFTYTPRLFPTPLRESKRTEEGDWISKNRAHLKTHPHFMNNKAVMDKLDGDMTETDPTWLKGKGDDFYRSQDYLSAINAYSTALEVDPNMANPIARSQGEVHRHAHAVIETDLLTGDIAERHMHLVEGLLRRSATVGRGTPEGNGHVAMMDPKVKDPHRHEPAVGARTDRRR